MSDPEILAAIAETAASLRGKGLNAGAVDSRWALPSPAFDPRAELAAARASGTLASWLAGLAPSDPNYRALVLARGRYAEIVASGGWSRMPTGTPLKLDVVDPRVVQLRHRLALEGYEAPIEDEPQRFDATLQATLGTFQRRHALAQDGVTGPSTLAALNVSAAERLAAIDANLERARWAPRLGEPRIEVDIAAAQLTLFEAGVEPLRMRVIVGTPSHQTPLFASQVDAVVFNPPWNVPSSIAANELWPKEARNPGYLARNGFSVVGGQLRQAPGPGSALGFVKFDLDSPFGVYLHDTPSRSLFDRDRRALSHGCIRLQLPRDLAARLLAAQGWTREQVEAAIAARSTRRVGLSRPTPVVLAYRTAVAEADGAVTFRPDVYGWDAKLLPALARRAAARP